MSIAPNSLKRYSTMSTLNEFFKNINSSVCSDLEKQNIGNTKQSHLSTEVVADLCELLNLPIGEQFQLQRFANGRRLLTYCTKQHNLEKNSS